MSNFNFISDKNKSKIYICKKWLYFLILLIGSIVLFSYGIKYIFSFNKATEHLKLVTKPNHTTLIKQKYNPFINIQYVGYIDNKQQILAIVRLANQQLITVKIGDILLQKNNIITQIDPNYIIILTTNYLQNSKKWHKLSFIQGEVF